MYVCIQGLLIALTLGVLYAEYVDRGDANRLCMYVYVCVYVVYVCMHACVCMCMYWCVYT